MKCTCHNARRTLKNNCPIHESARTTPEPSGEVVEKAKQWECKHKDDCDYPDCGTRSFPKLKRCWEKENIVERVSDAIRDAGGGPHCRLDDLAKSAIAAYEASKASEQPVGCREAYIEWYFNEYKIMPPFDADIDIDVGFVEMRLKAFQGGWNARAPAREIVAPVEAWVCQSCKHPIDRSPMGTAGICNVCVPANSGAKRLPSKRESGEFAKLQHEYDSTRGLWCIDQDPKDVTHDWIKQNAFQLK